MGSRGTLSNLPGWLLGVIIVMSVIELALLVVALIVLVRTPSPRLTLPVWAWLLIIVLISTFGPIAFLVAGRRPRETPDAPRRGGPGGRTSAADLLYGSPTDPDERESR